jgi:glycine zipper 2TM protein
MTRRRSTSLAAALTLAALLGACAKGEQAANQPADSAARNLTLAPSESSAAMKDVPAPTPAAATPVSRPAAPKPTTQTRPPAPPPPATKTIAAGTAFDAAVTDTITSRKNHVGDAFTAHVVVDAGASASAIPSGAEVHGTIVEVKPAPNPSTPGTLTLAVSSITINGKNYDVEAKIDSLETVRQGRGVTTGDAAKVGAGAVAGAILGRVIGGNKKGTIIGGVVGAAAGAGVAATSKDSDIVLPAGAHIHLTLTKALVVAAR